MMQELRGSRRARVLGLGLLVVTFLTGGLAGTAVNRVMVTRDAAPAEEERRGERRERRPSTEDFLSGIDLRPEQRARIDSILAHRRGQIEATWHELRPRMRAYADSARHEIAEVLDEDQRTAYEAFLAEEKERERRKRSGDRNRKDDRR